MSSMTTSTFKPKKSVYYLDMTDKSINSKLKSIMEQLDADPELKSALEKQLLANHKEYKTSRASRKRRLDDFMYQSLTK